MCIDKEKSEEWKFLIHAHNDLEADVIIGLLETHGIPTVKKYKAIENYVKIITGMVTGVWLYVPGDMLDLASQILKATEEKHNIQKEMVVSEEYEEVYNDEN